MNLHNTIVALVMLKHLVGMTDLIRLICSFYFSFIAKLVIKLTKLHQIFYYEILFHLTTEAKATIQGPSDYYVKIGSSVNLVCAVSQGPHELGSIYWHKGNFYWLNNKVDQLVRFIAFNTFRLSCSWRKNFPSSKWCSIRSTESCLHW